MKQQVFIALVVSFFCGVHLAAAATDSFTVGLTYGTDTTPPTTPTGVQATSTGPHQIDLQWNPSTDNVQLAGYTVYQNGAAIATTTLTSYADTGLIASTSYTYTIEAFDTFHNRSTSSVPVTATTTSPAIIPVVTHTPTSTAVMPQTNGTKLDMRMSDLHITPHDTSVDFSWKTNVYSQFELRWGRLSAYDLGYIQDSALRRDHVTQITNLEPGTTYQYQLTGFNQRSQVYVLSSGSFATTGGVSIPPLNVSGLTAQVVGNDVHLQWSNPRDSRFARVRVVRNPFFYPMDPSDGAVVYEGRADRLFDVGVLSARTRQYYTVFTYDTDGAISSGAIVLASRPRASGIGNGGGTTTNSGGGTGTIPVGSSEGNSTTTTSGSITTQFADFYMTQGDRAIHATGDRFTITNQVPILVQVPYDRVPKHLKSIVMQIDGTTAYMLRVSKDAKTYDAYIPAITIGTHTITFTIYDYATHVMKELPGTLVVQQQHSVIPFNTRAIPPLYMWIGGASLFLLVLIAVLLRLWY